MVYSEARRLRILGIWAHTTMLYALERESDLRSTSAVFVELSEGRDVGSGPVSRIWNLPPNGLPLDQSLQRDGAEGLVDRSRSPHSCSHATLEPIENAIFALRAKHRSWGARKLEAQVGQSLVVGLAYFGIDLDETLDRIAIAIGIKLAQNLLHELIRDLNLVLCVNRLLLVREDGGQRRRHIVTGYVRSVRPLVSYR